MLLIFQFKKSNRAKTHSEKVYSPKITNIGEQLPEFYMCLIISSAKPELLTKVAPGIPRSKS